jgi:predicted nucleic acid-binding protein
MILVDSDVLIDVLRKDPTAVALLGAIRAQNEFGISVVSRMETIRGCLNREFQQRAENLLNKARIFLLSEQVSARADDLITAHYLGNNMSVTDALIAATAIEYDLPLLTKNQRDFRFISGLKLLQYPTVS